MSAVLSMWVRQLDQLGMGEPDNNEAHPEDICTVCDRRIVDHPGRERFGLGDGSARWPHRYSALLGVICGHLVT